MLENNTISLVLNFMDGLSRYIEYKKKCKKLENRKYKFYEKPVKYEKIRFVVKKDEDCISESDKKISHRRKKSCTKRKKREFRTRDNRNKRSKPKTTQKPTRSRQLFTT